MQPIKVTARQLPLFARKANVVYPPRQVSADSLGEVEADDQHRYYIKGDLNGIKVRASEWLCTHLAEEVHLGAPQPMVIEMPGGTTVFGSRRLAGVADDVTTRAYLTTATSGNAAVQGVQLAPLLSSIYAFDLFVNNEDRHLGNYLSIDDQGVRRMYAFDFSRALFWGGYTGFPMIGSHTRSFGRVLRALHGFDMGSAVATIDRIASVSTSTIEGFINRMPADWLPDADRTSFVTWWSSTAGREARIANIRKGIGDGSLL